LTTPKNSSQTHSTYSNQHKPFIGKTEALIIGLVLVIVGSIVGGSFEKGTLTNYAGFCMLLVGIVAFVAGICSILTANIKNRMLRENPEFYKVKKKVPIYSSIWAIGTGVVLAVLGSMFASTYDRALLMNTIGFCMLLTGIGILVLGFSIVALEIVKIELRKDQKQKIRVPRSLFFSIILLGLGVGFLSIGTLLTESYAKNTMFNDIGFIILIVGIAILCLGTSGTVSSILKAQSHNQNRAINEPYPRVIFGSIWAVGIGAMLLIIGSILSGNFAENTFINYTGFGMLIAGAGVFVYGLFEAVRSFAMGYLNYRLAPKAATETKNGQNQQQGHMSRFSIFWKNMVRTSLILNLAGIIAAVCILFFSIWQLDIIVSGPVWWSSGEYGTGIGWSHPEGAYANDYFQCFVWKTTIGQAYDTLFMLIFIAFIIMFLSAYFWPKHNRTTIVKLKDGDREISSKNLQLDQEKENAQPKSTAEHNQSTSSNETKDQNIH
jgi:hypothetical protein